MLVRESIKFERGLNPKQAMGVGIASQIAEYAEDLTDWEVVGTIIEDSDLEVETKKTWINHLLKTNPEKYDFDEYRIMENFIDGVSEDEQFRRETGMNSIQQLSWRTP